MRVIQGNIPRFEPQESSFDMDRHDISTNLVPMNKELKCTALGIDVN
jgi:hypothetical protein